MIDGILYYFCVFIIIDLATEIHERKYTEAEASAKYLSLSAGNTITLSGASLKADDKAELTAGKDIRLTAEKDLYAEDASVGKRKGSYYQRLKTADEAVKGTLISAAGEVRLKAGKDISLKGSGITSEKGKISLTAGKDISMMDEKERHETIHEYHSHVSGLLSSKTKDLYEAGKTDTVRGSFISGNETHMESGRGITAKQHKTPTCSRQVGVYCFHFMQSYRSLLKSWFSFFSAADSLFSVSSVQASLSARSSLAI